MIPDSEMADEQTLPLFADAGAAVPKTPAPARQPSYIRDHRERLRQRFLQGGAAALPDYELLELVLFRAIPRQDVKPLARQLLERFGDFNHVLSAGLCQLSQVPGVGDAVICELKIVEAAAHRLSQSNVIRRPVVSGWDVLVAYCRTTMAHRETEQFRVLYLDLKNVLIADELQAKGTIDHVPVYPREVVNRAQERTAAAFSLVQTHPSGDPNLSEADIVMTQKIQLAAEALGLTVHEPLIIGKSAELSFRASHLL